MSRQFVVKGRIHLYSDDEPIFFQREPNFNKKPSHNCKTCDLKFDNVKQMNYCQFCGCAQCSQCLIKTKPFYGEAQLAIPGQNAKPQEKKRGKICTLCDRKFLINSIMSETF